MTLHWLGQDRVMQLQPGHIYRGRWLVPGRPTDIPCPAPQSTIDTIQLILKNLGGGQWEDPVVSQNTQVFDLLSQYGPWPMDRREVPPAFNPNRACVVWTQSVPTAPVNLPIDVLQGALNAIGGKLLNFWDETSGQRLVDPPPAVNQVPINPPPTVNPSTPPFVPPPIINVVPGAGPQAPKEEKKMSPIVWGLGVVVIIGTIALLTSSRS